jgi:type I restriction enzyme R subunit
MGKTFTPEDGFVERPSMAMLAELGWETVEAFRETFGRGGTLERDSEDQVYLAHRLKYAVEELNPGIPAEAREDAVEELMRDRSVMDPVRASKEVYDLIRDGYHATWRDKDDQPAEGLVRFIDFRHVADNDFLASNQVWVAGELHRKRPDAILFVNGIPLVLMEFKEPGKPVKNAFDDNLTDYHDTIPQLFIPLGFVLLSNGTEAKVGAPWADWGRFWDWNQIDNERHRGVVPLETALKGTCRPDRLLDIVENFTSYVDQHGGLVKMVAQAHQYLGVNAALERLWQVRAGRDKKLGVFWHSQGSGKSMSMVWFTQKVLRRVPGDWTFVMVTDRAELDGQLFGNFVDAGAVPREAKVHAESGAELRQLLGENHRYVFTLIQKFHPAPGEKTMPVLSERDNVIVITDEAHRSQYDTLAMNMRAALPNASFMGFTGTPLLAGEEKTMEVFGDYVSVYSYADAEKDGATVPLFYENRTPELQLANDKFGQELIELLDQADIDDDDEETGQLARRFNEQYVLLTRPDRLEKVARDLVEHFVGRGFDGKAMYVGLDKAAAVRMYDLVKKAWAAKLADLREQAAAKPDDEWLAGRVAFMAATDMAVVVSPGQNEIKQLAEQGLDIKPHRRRMNQEDLAAEFKDSDNPLRIVFVCAMWRTGFDAPAVSTIYLDRPMRNHTLMQTITRANRVFPDKNNGLIVDYVGVFRDLEKALALWGDPRDEHETGGLPIRDITALAAQLGQAVEDANALCRANGVDLGKITAEFTGPDTFHRLALVENAVDSLLVNDQVRSDFLDVAARARRLLQALMPHPTAGEYQTTVTVLHQIAHQIKALRQPVVDIAHIAGTMGELFDRSITAQPYVIGQGTLPGTGQIDLSQIDFEALARRFGGRPHAEADWLASLLQSQATEMARHNPTRQELVDKVVALIARYNAGSLNINEYLRRLRDLTRALSDEEKRTVTEGLNEDELAIFDLLTKPEPTLTAAERETVKASAKDLLAAVADKLVLDWRRKAQTAAAVRQTIRDVLAPALPEAPYPQELFDDKVAAIYNHLLTTDLSAPAGQSPY